MVKDRDRWPTRAERDAAAAAAGWIIIAISVFTFAFIVGFSCAMYRWLT